MISNPTINGHKPELQQQTRTYDEQQRTSTTEIRSRKKQQQQPCRNHDNLSWILESPPFLFHPGSRQSPSTSRTPLRANLRRHSCISPCTPASRAFPDTPARNHRTALARTTVSEGKHGSSASTSRRNRAFGRGIVSTRSGCVCGDPDLEPLLPTTSCAGSRSVSIGKKCWSSAR